jgi:hypothetical protein
MEPMATGQQLSTVRPRADVLGCSAFISHASRDGAPYAACLEEQLSRAGVRTWLCPRDMDPALDFMFQLEQAISTSDVFVACITPDVQREASFVRREIMYAQRFSRPIAVALFAPVVPPIAVVTNTHFDFGEDWETAFDRLLQFCRGAVPA